MCVVLLFNLLNLFDFNLQLQVCTMNASMSFRKNLSPITIAASSMRCLHHWFTGTSQRSIAPLKPRLKHFYWILISLNIFICLAYCDDDVITPSSQPYPQKRGGGKYSVFFFLVLYRKFMQFIRTMDAFFFLFGELISYWLVILNICMWKNSRWR